MRINRINRICVITILAFLPFICYAQSGEVAPLSSFQGEINSDDINIRQDSTVSAKVICVLNTGDPVEVIRESYGWYKIRLPKTAPSFISKGLVTLIDEKSAKVAKNNVNIRFAPDESSVVLGQAGKNEVINILDEKEDWYKIEPINNSFGWIHKKFVDKVDTAKLPSKVKKVIAEKALEEKVPQPQGADMIIEGVIKPYGRVFRRKATHRLISLGGETFMLKGNKALLDSLNHHKVKVTGKLAPSENQKLETIEIRKIEALD